MESEEIDYTYHPFQIDIEDVLTGFDARGNYHHPRIERTDCAQLPLTSFVIIDLTL